MYVHETKHILNRRCDGISVTLQESGTVFVRFSEDGLTSLNHTTANLFHPWIWAVLLLSYFDILLRPWRVPQAAASPQPSVAPSWRLERFSKWLDIREAKVATLASHSSVESVGSCLTKQDNKGFELKRVFELSKIPPFCDSAMLQGRLHYYSAPGLAPHVGHETPAGVHGLPCVHQGRLAENIILQETMPCP